MKTNAWETEEGTYEILIGASSEDIRLKGQRMVFGTAAPNPYEGKNLACYQDCDVENVPDAAFEALLGHPIPQRNWDRSKPLELNDALAQMEYARNPSARFAARFLKKRSTKRWKQGSPI